MPLSLLRSSVLNWLGANAEANCPLHYFVSIWQSKRPPCLPCRPARRRVLKGNLHSSLEDSCLTCCTVYGSGDLTKCGRVDRCACSLIPAVATGRSGKVRMIQNIECF